MMNRIVFYILMATGSVRVADSQGTDAMSAPSSPLMPSPLTIEGVRDPLTGHGCADAVPGAYQVRHLVISTHDRASLGKPPSSDQIWDVTPVPPAPLPKQLNPRAILATYRPPASFHRVRRASPARRWRSRPVMRVVKLAKSKRKLRRFGQKLPGQKLRPVAFHNHHLIARGGHSHGSHEFS